jgi:hypothetical protein
LQFQVIAEHLFWRHIWQQSANFAQLTSHASKLGAFRRRGPSRNNPLFSSCATPMDRRSAIFISRMSEGGDRRRSHSPAMRRGRSRSTRRSCRMVRKPGRAKRSIRNALSIPGSRFLRGLIGIILNAEPSLADSG